MKNYLSDDVCACITNYDFSDNASHLKDEFKKYFHTVLIDSDSPTPPINLDITIPNTYYPGLWNASVEYAISKQFKYLIFVASDLQINNVGALCRYATEAIGYDNIGVYTPSVSSKSRTAFPILRNRTSSYIRECGVVEGFFFLAKTEILKTIFPLSPNFKYGWAVDVLTCHKSYELNYICVVDDRVEIFHPASKADHAIDTELAETEWKKLIGSAVMNDCTNRQKILNNAHNFVNQTSTLDLGCGKAIRNPFLAVKKYGIDLMEDNAKDIVSADLNIEKIPFTDSFFEYCTAFDFIHPFNPGLGNVRPAGHKRPPKHHNVAPKQQLNFYK